MKGLMLIFEQLQLFQ